MLFVVAIFERGRSSGKRATRIEAVEQGLADWPTGGEFRWITNQKETETP